MPEGYDLRAFDVLDSTNAQCHRIVEEVPGGNIWVTANRQTAGRGRRGREWISGPGNLFASLLYALDCDLGVASQVSFVSALAVRDVVADILANKRPVTCKWPNDILVAGKKISGILLETTGKGGDMPSHVIIGIGLNVTHHPEYPQYPATNLEHETGQKIERDMVLCCLVQAMDHWINEWKIHGFPHIRDAWKKKASGLGQQIVVRLQTEELRGCFTDMDERGALILEFEGKRRHITAGDVFFT